jgi:hypothetical protein
LVKIGEYLFQYLNINICYINVLWWR